MQCALITFACQGMPCADTDTHETAISVCYWSYNQVYDRHFILLIGLIGKLLSRQVVTGQVVTRRVVTMQVVTR